ncbi:MAG: ABC transporter permease [Butyricicoccus sp.]
MANSVNNVNKKKKSQAALVWRRLKKNKMAILGLVILSLIIFFAVFADFFFDYETMVIQQSAALRLKPPSAEHWLGTDEVGRDILARIVHGARISLPVAFVTIAVATVVGGLLGAISGYGSKRVDNIIMRIMDVFLAIPSILLSIALVAALGTSMTNMILAISISNIPPFARIVRSAVLTLRNVEYIEAAKCYGCSSLRIILKHILPNGIGPIIVSATLCLGQTILSISSMGYLGLGVASPTPEWGTIISENKMNIQAYPYLGLIPGICICLTVMAVNFIGDGLRDAFDPRTKN